MRLELPPPDLREIRAAGARLGPAAAVLVSGSTAWPTSSGCRWRPSGPARLALADMEPRSGLEGANDDDGSETFGRRLWGICREQGRYRLASLARRLPCRARLEDLVLPESAKVVLRQIVGHLRHRHRVLLEWGFERTSERGLGIGALFAGASGTGKTMAAEVLGRRAGLDLYRIDSRRWSASTSARPRRTSGAYSTRPRRAARCCSSTRPTRCSASGAR